MDWAYPVTPQLPRPTDTTPMSLPGSPKQYSPAQIDDPFNPPDWYPAEHPAMPNTVSNGRAPAVRACALCHLPSGDGHPESSGLAGLPAAYIIRQMTEFKAEHRKGIRAATMVGIGKAITDEETKAAAEYFASLKPTKGYTKVVESASVPKSYVGAGGMRFISENGGMEPIGSRIIELPDDEARAKLRDPHTGFTAHVPPGSIAKGEALAANGGSGKTIQCGICHGPALKGLGEVPPLTGRSPQYMFRQLNDIKTGNRAGPAIALMQAVVTKLDLDDMIALAAYLGSREP
jgi:cytochrome c553